VSDTCDTLQATLQAQLDELRAALHNSPPHGGMLPAPAAQPQSDSRHAAAPDVSSSLATPDVSITVPGSNGGRLTPHAAAAAAASPAAAAVSLDTSRPSTPTPTSHPALSAEPAGVVGSRAVGGGGGAQRARHSTPRNAASGAGAALEQGSSSRAQQTRWSDLIAEMHAQVRAIIIIFALSAQASHR
jgi:hypothetical protein